MKYSDPRKMQHGMTLIEILVSIAILAVAMVIALSIYDLSRKSYKRGENVTEQQQSVRIGFDQMTADLRMTGFNYNPDGSKTRPDEQFEAAYDTAIVVRGDYDAEDPTASVTPESTLGGSTFLSVSTGNDEIYAFVLAKPDGSSTGTLTFQADVKDAPRDGAVETVSIPNVAMVQDDPPYTLYRISLNNNVGTWGSSDFFTRTPLVDNVYSMNFKYYNQTGLQANSTFDLTSTTDDIGGVDGGTAEATRSSIRRVGVELTGLTPDPDLNWVDTGDPYAATQNQRKFALSGDIHPRNIGMVGIKDINADVTPPTKPATPTLLAGHCGGLWLTWTANPTEDQVAYYRVNFGTASGSYSDQRTTGGNSLYVGALADANTYYIALQAVDAAGNQSVLSNEASTTTSNVNTPNTPANLGASTNLNGAVSLAWDPVTTNSASQPSGDPQAPMIRDLAGYRVYRGTTNSFNNPSTVVIADESVVQNESSPDYTDTNVVNCRYYNYWVTAVDTCGLESSPSALAAGNATSSVLPAAPANPQAFFSGGSSIRITWDPVTTDVETTPIFIDTYNLYRSPLVPTGGPSLPSKSSFTYVATVTGATEYMDSTFVPDGYTVYYYVTAQDDCGNVSAASAIVNPQCAFSGDVVFVNPADNSPVAGVVPVDVTVLNTTDTFTQLTLEFIHDNTGAVKQKVIVDPGPSWTYNWLADPPGPYTINATVENSTGCSKTATIHVSASFSVGCCLSPPNPDLNPITLSCDGGGNAKCATISYQVINNNCLTAVEIEEMTVDWQDVTGLNPQLTGVRFDGTPIWNVVPASSAPASQTFSAPKPQIGFNRNAVNPVTVTYTYTQNMSKKQGPNWKQNTLTTSYSFRLLDETGSPTSITGVCGPSTGMFDNMITGIP